MPPLQGSEPFSFSFSIIMSPLRGSDPVSFPFSIIMSPLRGSEQIQLMNRPFFEPRMGGIIIAR